MKKSKDIDKYIQAAPKKAQSRLRQMRTAIRNAAPQATEAISYRIPTYKLDGNLVHFGAFKDHIGFFPTSSGVAAFKKELSKYAVSKGTIQFPLDQVLPLGLVTRTVKFRVKQQLEQLAAKGKKVCSRGHVYNGSGPCPVCWPGRLKKVSKKK